MAENNSTAATIGVSGCKILIISDPVQLHFVEDFSKLIPSIRFNSFSNADVSIGQHRRQEFSGLFVSIAVDLIVGSRANNGRSGQSAFNVESGAIRANERIRTTSSLCSRALLSAPLRLLQFHAGGWSQ
jgi:hypothetical protein